MDEWMLFYRRIASEFNYSLEADQNATELLSELLGDNAISPREIEQQIRGRSVLVLGAGPSIDGDLDRMTRGGLFSRCISIAADGATSALLSRGMVPAIVVTDLDGRLDDICKAKELGSVVVVHAHGDNVEALARVVPKLRPALGTTQVLPRKGVYNFRGFTDGDRAVFLVLAMGASVVALAGMDLAGGHSKYERKRPTEVKSRKLLWGKRLLELAARRTSASLLNLTRAGREIMGFKRASPSDLLRIL